MTEQTRLITAELNAIAKELFPLIDFSRREYGSDFLALGVWMQRKIEEAEKRITRQIYANKTLTLNGGTKGQR